MGQGDGDCGLASWFAMVFTYSSFSSSRTNYLYRQTHTQTHTYLGTYSRHKPTHKSFFYTTPKRQVEEEGREGGSRSQVKVVKAR